ncbi:MAG: PLP-dependent aminotransferase family protein [Roseofilum sp. SBFL]|uniref:aminotransferase-like domain-containing protein n=2 Tax=Roseofilum TaxID=1233426 RepID=UPI001B00D092|nr:MULTISPECIES: PLP-dependent aminotransferase family protein [unclassified Roseofilum]MBP0012508.1 PLP-dependent aminotransferase family protein [Roseofilum sp. SID3]MBP0037583.1 PLP-dependent aminotransferase family protein [Roseofilum sp. SID1]MBP0041859.1 PLP-dependent aminotransferase family protein [Roseofilum sp. SBFL]
MHLRPIEQTQGANLYEQVANRIQALIAEGTLQPGDRLPSVRKVHQQMSVSISTALEAYRLLEDRGLIGAKPQSGYFVRSLKSPPEPDRSSPTQKSCRVDTSLVFQVNSMLRDPEIIQLGAAVPGMDLFPLSTLNRLMGQVMRQDPTLVHSYTPPPGCLEFRRAIARRLLDADCAVTPDQIVATHGATEAVYLSLRATTQPGDTVAIASPCYYGLLETLSILHLRALELPTHPREGICLTALETALKRKQISACALVSNFSNPLGTCMSNEKKQDLVELLARYQIPLIEDDVYGDLSFDGDRPKAIKAFDKDGFVLYCASYSKVLSPGLRVGWAIPGRYQSTVERLKLTVNMSTSPASQLAIAAFLANGGYDRHLRNLRRAYEQQMLQMIQAICHYFPEDTKVTRPTGGQVLWIELPPHFDAMELFYRAGQHKISISPGIMFSPSGSYGNCFRLNSGLPWSPEIEQAMETLGRLISEQEE